MSPLNAPYRGKRKMFGRDVGFILSRIKIISKLASFDGYIYISSPKNFILLFFKKCNIFIYNKIECNTNKMVIMVSLKHTNIAISD